MKTLTIAALLAAQLLTVAPPAMAAELADGRTQEMGAFGGLRLRVPLDGHARQRQVRAGLALAPTLHSRAINGESRTRIGEGLELGFAGNRPLTLSLAGTPVHRLGAAQDEPENEEEEGGGPSTIGWIAIGVGALIVGVVGAAVICMSDSDCIPSE